MSVLKTTLIRSLAIVCVSFFCSQICLAQSSATDDASKAVKAATQEGSSTANKAANAPEAETPEPLSFSVAGGNLNFTTTGTWKSVKPKSRMLEREIQVPRTENDNRDGRLTIMGAGGSIEANIARWEGQFSQADGSATKAKVTEETVENMKVTMVDISGVYVETMGGPFSGGKKVENPNFRVLAAIIETPESGNYFVKLIGPKATIGANEKAFVEAIKSVKLKE